MANPPCLADILVYTPCRTGGRVALLRPVLVHDRGVGGGGGRPGWDIWLSCRYQRWGTGTV